MIEFKARERRILEDRKRLALEALCFVQAEWLTLPKRVPEPQPGTASYKRWMRDMKKKEKEGRLVVHRLKFQRGDHRLNVIDANRARERHRQYKIAIESMENVAIEKLHTLLNSGTLSDRHIESLCSDSLQMLYDIIMSFLEHEDDEERYDCERYDCKLCDELFCSNRLRKEHARKVHYHNIAITAITECI